MTVPVLSLADLVKDGITAVVKYVNRASGSEAKESDSRREKVCLIFTPSS